MGPIHRNTEKLYYFYYVANFKSIQKTARQLNASASNISTSIKQLEELLETQLFVRSKKGVDLTPEGERLLSFCKSFYKELTEIRDSFHSDTQIKTKVRFGTFSSIAIYLGPKLFTQLKNDQDVTLSIHTDTSRNILEKLVNKDVDIALTVGSLKHPKIITNLLYQDYYSFYTLAQNKERINIEDQNLLYLPLASDDNQKTLEEYIFESKLNFKESFQLDSLEVILEYMRHGMGIGILPNNVANNSELKLRKIKLSPLSMRFGQHSFYMSYRNDLDISAKLINKIVKVSQDASKQL